MMGPAKNRLHGYEADWLTLLLETGLADIHALNEARSRVAREAVDDMNRRQEKRQAKRDRRRRERDEQ
jgi:hypothetical protein